MQVVVKFFTSYKTLAGVDQVTLDIPDGSTVNQLVKILARKFESTMLDREQSIIVVNEKIATREQIMNDGDTAMIFHQFAGG